jgi:hypothetical protein
MTTPELSVVVAHSSGGADLRSALEAVHAASAGIATEVIVAQSTGSAAAAMQVLEPDVRIVVAPSGTLVPVLWGLGAEVAVGRIVAFTTSQMRVSADWARALSESLRGDTVAVGGPIMPVVGASAAVTAGCLVRFSAFLPAADAGSVTVRDVAGDNAAYLRQAVQGEGDLLREGFWEVEFHRRFRAAGRVLRTHPSANATFVGPVRLGRLLRERFAHAQEFGATRVSRHGASRVGLLLAAPLVPLVLLARIGRRAWRIRTLRGPLLRAVPAIGLLTAAWAAGEAAGVLMAQRRPAG